jgi:hypothetical protein
MADKSSFTPEEWKVVISSPMVAGLAVTLAEPSGLWGMLKESMASARAMLTAATDPNSSPLMKAIVSDMETSQGRTIARDELKADLAGKSAAELKQEVIAKLKQAGQILDTKAPADAPAFKAWLKGVAEQVAEAAWGRNVGFRRGQG